MDDRLAALITTAQMLRERARQTRKDAETARDVQKRNGWDHYTVADYQEGSRDAYSIACSILAGAAGYATIDELADLAPDEPEIDDDALDAILDDRSSGTRRPIA